MINFWKQLKIGIPFVIRIALVFLFYLCLMEILKELSPLVQLVILILVSLGVGFVYKLGKKETNTLHAITDGNKELCSRFEHLEKKFDSKFDGIEENFSQHMSETIRLLQTLEKNQQINIPSEDRRNMIIAISQLELLRNQMLSKGSIRFRQASKPDESENLE